MKRWMTALAAVMMLAAATSALAKNDSEQKLDDATSVLQQFVNIPENKIPPALLRQAHGIAVIPSVFKIGFIGGFQRGKGVLSVRTTDGKWSDPAFISLTGGSVGFQAGVSSTDIILVFKSQRSVNRIANGQFSFGADASVAAGPVGRSVGASTNLNFNAEVYSYSRSRGLFAGVSLQGARLSVDQDGNWLFYSKAGIKAQEILERSDASSIPKAGQRFVYTLNRYMPASSDQFNYGSNTSGAADQNGQGQSDNNSQSSDQQGYGQTRPYNDSNNSGVTVERGDNSGQAGTSGYQGAGSGNADQSNARSGNQNATSNGGDRYGSDYNNAGRNNANTSGGSQGNSSSSSSSSSSNQNYGGGSGGNTSSDSGSSNY